MTLARRLAVAGCALGALALAGAARAGCIDAGTPEGQRLQYLAEDDAHEAIRQVGELLDALLQAPRPDRERIALLYSIEAHAYSELELNGEVANATARGLKWVDSRTGNTALNLLMASAENTYDEVGIERARAALEAARQEVPAGSMADSCLLISAGLLQYRSDRIDLAVRSLTRAYADSSKAGRKRQKVQAAAMLALVMRQAGDHKQALELIDEQAAWDKSHNLRLDLSVAHYTRGIILQDMGKYEEAIRELATARSLSLQLGDGQGAAFADLHICESEAEQGANPGTRDHCERALRAFQSSKSNEMIKQTRTTLAQLDLAAHHPAAALATLDQVLEKGGTDMTPRRVARIYKLRAQAEAALGRHEAAYADFTEYVRRYEMANEAERVRQVTALSTRFDTDREIERNQALQRQLDLTRERADRQRLQLRWTAALAVAGALVIALLGYIALTFRRHRRQLERLASEDHLTGLPNRRHAIALAGQMLANAKRRSEMVTVAVIDLDWFKRINDRCGHAAGDRALQEFACTARGEVRAGDLVARWGGEEFLIVMADCPLAYGLATLERLRIAVARIDLPAEAGIGHLTLSAGVTTNDASIECLEELVARADAALYQAKNGGRDRVQVAEEGERDAATGVHKALSGQ